ncbi:MAG: 4-(cytidine 5'-diphospho)-2-C-methyl-D-erythritol kinase [Pirellulaceae bacterium]
MFFQRSATGVSVLTPAKVNLYLELLGKRDDGFHELETIMASVDLYDSIQVIPDSAGKITLDCRWAKGEIQTAEALGMADLLLGDLPNAHDNLIWKAAERLRSAYDVAQGAQIVVEKKIPAAAGFGGASSDAAATLFALNMAWELGLEMEQLAEIAAELGSDVPFFLNTGTLGSGVAICRGRGERIEELPPAKLHLVLIRPAGGLSTAAVYREATIPTQPHSIDPMVSSLAEQDFRGIAAAMHNRLAAPARKLSTEIDRLAIACDQLDVVAHQMSGSGSGYFALCRDRNHAHRVANQLKAQHLGLVFPATTTGMIPLRH